MEYQYIGKMLIKIYANFLCITKAKPKLAAVSYTHLSYTEQQAQNGVVYTFGNMIEIESKETNFSAYMLFSTGEKYLRDRISFNIDKDVYKRQALPLCMV